MLKYRINRRKANKTKIELKVDNIQFVDFENLVDDEDQQIEYNGDKVGKIMATCECDDIDKIKDGSFINCVNTLFLDFVNTDGMYEEKHTFNLDYQVTGVNPNNKSFSFYFDKYYTLEYSDITTGKDNENKVYITFESYHFFDEVDNNVVYNEKIPIYFRYVNVDNEIKTETIEFQYVTPKTLVTSYDSFDTEEKENLYRLIFGSTIQQDESNNELVYVNRFDVTNKLTQEQYDALTDEEKVFYDVNNTEKEGDLSGFVIFRDTFLFGDKTNYEFSFEKPLANINIPIVNTFETTLHQMDLLNEQFVEAEKKKAINRIVDIEKDVYYPCISNEEQDNFTDVYTIKFNLHFREHRGDDWLVENESFWNGVELDGNGHAVIVESDNKKLTNNNMSDLLTYLGFTNNDVHYQKNKLKKSFLRLMYFDSTNPANQNMMGYSTIFFDTGDLFAKYTKYINTEGYTAVGASKKEYGVYTPSTGKVGIRVDREIWEEDKRLSSQLVVKDKNMSRASSEGFYIYIWKDNEMALPQDLYMKVEFNHAGYGRTVPFMMPYWDSKKWESDTTKRGIKAFQEILNDWNDTKTLENGKVVWTNGTDGHYGIRQYTKFSYIHLKYKYDVDNDKHIYYLDPDTYGNSVVNQDTNEIEINLYEAKVE